MIEKKYLPVGSVVRLLKGSHDVIIVGFCLIIKNQNNRQYDYVGLPYPEGFMGMASLVYFDHSDIKELISKGYINDAEKNFKNNLEKVLENISIDKEGHEVSTEKINELLSKGIGQYEQY